LFLLFHHLVWAWLFTSSSFHLSPCIQLFFFSVYKLRIFFFILLVIFRLTFFLSLSLISSFLTSGPRPSPLTLTPPVQFVKLFEPSTSPTDLKKY
jgi:hypothetical protein